MSVFVGSVFLVFRVIPGSGCRSVSAAGPSPSLGYVLVLSLVGTLGKKIFVFVRSSLC